MVAKRGREEKLTEYAVAGDGVRLAYEVAGGSGRAVLLVHGFGSSREQNWQTTGWYRSLDEAGFVVAAMDCRGHGQSDKPHAESFYGHARMAEDAVTVMNAAGLTDCDVIGYSMGGFIALRLAVLVPARLRRMVLGGVGAHYLSGPRISSEGSREILAEALLVDDKSRISDPRGLMFRNFADQPGKDRIALAACMRAMSPPLPYEVLAQIEQPVLTICGEHDDISGPAEPLARIFHHGQFVTVSGRDHMSAVGDPRTRRAALDFLEL